MIQTNLRLYLVGILFGVLFAAAVTPIATARNTSIVLLPAEQAAEVTLASSSSDTLSRPRINDLGEVVWARRPVGGNGDVFSNLRGQITTGIIAMDPDINNLGEIIWRFGDGAGPNGITSNVRGIVLSSNGIDPYYDTPRINNNREIIAGRSGSPEWVWSNVRGRVVNSPNNLVRETEVNDSGEVVYTGDNHIYSTTRGSISPANYFAKNADINNLGEIVWQQSPTLMTGTIWEIWSNVRGKLGEGERPAIDDLGEVAWQHWNGSDFDIFSSTRGQISSGALDDMSPHINNAGAITWLRAEIFPVPEPPTALVGGFAVAGVIVRRRRADGRGQTRRCVVH